MAAKNRDVNKITQRWVANGSSSSGKYIDSIQSLTENPLDKAADNSAGYMAGIQRSEAAGTRARGLRAYGFDNWKRKTVEVGSVRLGQGMAASQDRYKRAMTDLLPFIDNLVSTLPPRGDLNQNIARADKMMRGMAGYRTRGFGG
jgi:hypothetical protein